VYFVSNLGKLLCAFSVHQHISGSLTMLLCHLLLQIYVLKNYRFKHTCNDDNDIRRRKQQKLAYHIFTCKFPVSYITISADHDIVMMR